MSDRKKNKKTIWIYAVVLFTSAFIVLLLTAYSQIKFNKNIDDYRTQLSSRERENLSFQTNLNTALEENKKIKIELDGLKKSIIDNETNIRNYEKELEESKSSSKKMFDAYEALMSAVNQYDKGNIVDSALILLKECDKSVLQKEALEKYNNLIGKTIYSASLKLYKEGYAKFKSKKYSEAEEKLLLSNEIKGDEYYSDDCLYFAAYSQYYTGKKDEAKKTAELLKQKFPNSSYIRDLNEVLN